MGMLLSAAKIVYQVVLDSFINPNPITSTTDEEYLALKPMWDTSSSCSHDCLDDTLPSDEAINEAMNGSEKPLMICIIALIFSQSLLELNKMNFDLL
jgi:hypothetical protein